MGNVMRNTLWAALLAAVFNAVIWIILQPILGVVDHNVTGAPVDTVGLFPVVIATILGVGVGGIGYAILKGMIGAKGFFWLVAILGLLSLFGPWTQADTYGTFVSLGMMHIVAVACLLYYLVGRKIA